MDTKKALITGIRGFTGKHLFNYLTDIKNPWSLYSIGRRNFEAEKLVHYPCNITDKQQVKEIISNVKPDYIFHLAGINHGLNYEDFYKVNVAGTKDLLEAVRKENTCCPRILVIGSSMEYGIVEPEALPIKEENPTKPVSDYGRSKLAQTLECLRYHKEFGLDIVVARTFNIIGPGISYRSVAGTIAKQIAEAEGNSIRRAKVIRIGNLESKRDFVDVEDVVKAYVLLITKGRGGEIYNVCSGKAYSAKYILDFLLSQTAEKFTIQQDLEKIRPCDIPCQVGNFLKIHRELNWKPLVGIDTSLFNTLEYFRAKERRPHISPSSL